MNINLGQYYEEKLAWFVSKGIAASKTEALRMAIREFENKVKDDEEEMIIRPAEPEAVEKMKKIDAEIKAGKRKVLTAKEALGEYAKYLEQ